MNRILLDDCQPEKMDPMKARFHRIFLALVFTGVLYFQGDPNQSQRTHTVSPSERSPIWVSRRSLSADNSDPTRPEADISYHEASSQTTRLR